MPDDAVRALIAATGMTPAQARALTASRVRPHEETVRRTIEENAIFNAKSFRRGGEGKTSTSGDLSAALSLTFGQRAHMIDLDPSGTLDWPDPTPPPAFLVDLPWPSDSRPLPVDPALFDAFTKALGIDQDTDAGRPAKE